MNEVIPQLVVGAFFVATGYRKLFVPSVHEQVFKLFDSHGVPQPMKWAVIIGEFAGGMGLLVGLFLPWLGWLAALGLVPIMLGAFILDTLPGIEQKWHARKDEIALNNDPINWVDVFTWWISKLICNPEALLLVILVAMVLS